MTTCLHRVLTRVAPPLLATTLLLVANPLTAGATDTTTSTTIPPTTTTIPPTTTTIPPTTTTRPPTTTTTHPPRKVNQNPFSYPPLRRFLTSRTSEVTAGLVNMSTGHTYLYHPATLMVSASMVKIDEVACRLYQTQARGGLSDTERALATQMVEYSNNDAAQAMWEDLGQLPALTRCNARFGYTQSVTNWAWGLLATDPLDELALLRTIVLPNHVLTSSSRAYLAGLMEHVTPYQRFGVPTGVPAGAIVGVKNGWYPEKDTGWQVNTAGFVLRGHTRYLLVVMTGHNPSESYGLRTVNTAAQLSWNFESARLP